MTPSGTFNSPLGPFKVMPGVPDKTPDSVIGGIIPSLNPSLLLISIWV